MTGVAVQGLVEGLERLFPTFGSRLLGTVVVLLLLAAIEELVRRLGPRLKDRFGVLTVETAQATTMTLVLVLVSAVLIVIWRATGQAVLVLETLNFGRTEVVKAVLTGALLAAAYTLTRGTKRVIGRFADERGAISRHQQEVAHHLTQISIYVIAGLMVLSLWRVRIANLLIGAGVLGIVLGLAARQTLSAVLAGFIVLFSRPFELGDWIEVDDSEGIVQDISIFNTRIRTFDGEVVLIPNDVITATEVINRSRLGRYRVEVDVGVDYDADVERAGEVAGDAIREADLPLSQPSPRVVFTQFGDSAIGLRLRFWIDDPDAERMWRAKTQVIQAVKAAFEAEGIKIPFPQRELMARNEAGGFQLSESGAAVEASPERAADGEGE